VDTWANSIATERGFSCAASRRGRVACVGDSPGWRDAVEHERGRWGGMLIERLSLGEALVRLKERPGALDVIVTESHLVTPVVDAAAHFADSQATVALAWMSDSGPGVFAPGVCDSDEVAGFGVTDPTGMLFTASLLLAEGLKRRSASRTLERAVGEVAGCDRPRETRSFTDAVLEMLPQARTDVEHFDEVWR
jgi:isocitrate/isopropylmalate dehydrogenase